MLSGDNSILRNATTAKTETERATIIENAQTAYNYVFQIILFKNEKYKIFKKREKYIIYYKDELLDIYNSILNYFFSY